MNNQTSAFGGLRTCIYSVSDLGKAKAWYSNILGFRPYFDEPFYVGFNVAGYELGLIPDDTPNEQKGGVNTYWAVDDVKATYDRLILAGATTHEEPHNVGGEIVVGAVKDPWGNIFGMIYNPEFKLVD